ncbi:BZ3500_MvSof-1268-A1-R1_Chr2-1g04411 [Microbotryum saponariae]|uniref:BZ3500_MvSof-1268-A1-R1_Chr2-1g04411 protein n=1 Tax=Microbotryum saponariae TaxID=289078 RepID=A0A2X0KAP1_9BASI|nr:BZ3500_MvSof-1268-A1-R1_Chr2-1g04411 [Microbotryum saponariae]SCZ91625.1 BZ3501_MvSof-1269-A2-R1_Chr2-1g04067 [Microbotryum saponariae]
MAVTASMSATVKSVLSADTSAAFLPSVQLVLRSKVLSPNSLPRERVVHLDDGLTAPRVGNRDREDEPWAFDAREYLRALLVGKTVNFQITRTISTTTPPLEFARVFFTQPDGEQLDVGLAVVKAGWAKLRDSPKGAADGDEDPRRAEFVQAEEEAKVMARGMWATSGPPEQHVNFSMPEDPSTFLAQYKGQPLDAIIEAVPNGSTVRARLLLSPTHHQVVGVGLAGVRAPRAGNLSSAESSAPTGEEFGDEARFFVETRLLQRMITITLLSLPTPAVAPSAFNSLGPAATPAPATMFIGTVAHPAGNIAALLIATGLARIVDWHAGFLSQSPTPGMMAELRKAEAEAKGARRGVWKSLPAATPTAAAQAAQHEKERKFEGVVTRVWGADMLSIVKTGETKERRIQLASVRQPKLNDPKVGGLQAEGKELMRKKLIGKSVNVNIDYVKPAEGDYEARECATIRVAGGANVAEILVEKGLLHVIRHRQGDEQRSSDYDKLLAAEAKALAETKGVHSGKEYPVGRIIDASESAQKAAPFLSSFKRQGRAAGVVDYVAAGSRFKVFIPKQDIKLTLVLSGIRAPRTARNASEKSEPFGAEAAQFAGRKCMQKDVEILIDSADKSGGFIGKMFLGKDDFAVLLVKEGLARVDEYAAEKGAKDLVEAQDEAKRNKKGIWSNYDAAADAADAAVASSEPAVARREYVDVVVSDVRGSADSPFSFAVQVLGSNGSIPELERLMSELTVFHEGTSGDPTPANFLPRNNDLVSAKFSQDDVWYRARIRRANPAKKEAEVLYVDYGNSETIPYSRLRPLAAQFKSLESQAKDATLSFVTLLDHSTEYGLEAQDRFRDLCEGRQLVANVDARDPGLLHLSLFDPNDPESAKGHEASINVQLVREGYARVDQKSRFRQAYPQVVKALERATEQAKRDRAGAYELGDIFED